MASSEVNMKHTVNINEKENFVLQLTNKERKENECTRCEVILLTNGVRHFAHKTVLVSNSDFFRQYFEKESQFSSLHSGQAKTKNEKVNKGISASSEYESNENSEYNANSLQHQTRTTILLPGIKPDELSHILEYMYTSNLTLTAKNVNEILFAACLLQITSVIELCAECLIKRPDWRSPLVSPRLLNFVKSKSPATSTISEYNVSHHGNSPANDARTTIYESVIEQSQTNERLTSPNTLGKRKGATAVKIRQGKTPTQNLSDFLKRRHQFFSSSVASSECSTRKSTLCGMKHSSANGHNFCDPGKDITVDSEELSRELMKNYRLKMRHPFIVTPNPGQKLSYEYSNFKQQNQLYLKSGLDIVSNPVLLNKQQRRNNRFMSTFPQIDAYGRSLTAAYAPTFGIPLIPSKFFGFPTIESAVSPLFQKTVMKASNTMQNQETNCAIVRDPSQTKQIPINRYSGSIAAILVPPEKVHEEVPYPSALKLRPNNTLINKTSAYPAQINLITYKNSYMGNCSAPGLMTHAVTDVERSCVKPVIDRTSRPKVNKFSPSIVTRKSVSEIYNYVNRDIAQRNMQQNDTITHTNKPKSRFESEPQIATCAASPTTNNKVDIEANMSPDYPTRKRKLLAAQSHVRSSACKSSKIDDFLELKNKITRNSTEGDKIARKRHKSKISYPESDDSGRPSSV